jgi:PEGA domain
MSSGMPTFVWFGSLATVPPRAMIERCQALSVSARAELRSGERRARIEILGGEVASVTGADPKVVAGWTDGSFRVTQVLPDFGGDLTSERELKGTLADKSVKQLLAWAQEHRLTIKFDLYHDAERAHLEVANGRVAEVVVDGKADLAALGRVELWREGEWRAALKPLFLEETVPVFIPEGDMTPMPMAVPQASENEDPPWLELKQNPPPPDSVAWLTPSKPVAAVPATPEPPPAAPAEPAATTPDPADDPLAKTTRRDPLETTLPYDPLAATAPRGPDYDPLAATIPSAPAFDQTVPDMQAPKSARGRRGRITAAVVGGVVVLAAATALTVRLARKPSPATSRKAETADAAPLAQAEPQRQKRKPEHDRPAPSRAELRDRAKRMIDKARREIIAGHRKAAIALLEEARKLEPENAAIRTYLQQARGKTGEGTLTVESKPKAAHVLVDGADVGPSPVKIKLPAGEHTVQIGERSEDVEIVKDKKKHVKLNLREHVARGSKG